MICLKGCSCFMGLFLPEKFRKIFYWLGYLYRFANRELIPYAKCYSIDCCHILEIELICKRNFTGPIQDYNIEVFHYVSLNPHVLQRTFYLFEKIHRGGFGAKGYHPNKCHGFSTSDPNQLDWFTILLSFSSLLIYHHVHRIFNHLKRLCLARSKWGTSRERLPSMFSVQSTSALPAQIYLPRDLSTSFQPLLYWILITWKRIHHDR